MTIAYCAGFGAAKLNLLRAQNPYPANTVAYAEWDLGWYDGQGWKV